VRSLRLRNVVAEDAELRRVISWCWAMERLMLDDCHRAWSVVIRGPSLKELEIHSYRPLRVRVTKAPVLESAKLILFYDAPDYSWNNYDNSDSEIAHKRPDDNNVQELFDFEAMQKKEHNITDEAINIVTFLSGLAAPRSSP
jgi:hypothetical protein